MYKVKFFVFVALFVGYNLYSQQTELISEHQSPKNQMIFLTYHIQKSDGNADITFIQKSIADGRIKGFSIEEQYNKLGHLECTLLDKDLNPIETLFIENPLEKVVEFVNESGNLEKRIIVLDKTDFTFRMPYTSEALYARIHEVSNSESQNIILTKL